MKVKGICRDIVEQVVQRTKELSQGRNVGSIGFIDEEGYLSSMTEPVDGGLGGIPFRSLLGQVADMAEKSILEGLIQIPENAVFIITRPGKTGLITDVSAVDFFWHSYCLRRGKSRRHCRCGNCLSKSRVLRSGYRS